MAFRSDAAHHVDSGDGNSGQEILQTQQTSVRIVTADGDAVRTGRLSCIFAYSVFIVGTRRRHRVLPPHCLSIPIREYPLYLDRYSEDDRRMTCAEASSALRRHGQDRP